MDLVDRVALITGGARMGEAIAQILGDRRCRVVLTWRHSKRAIEKAAINLRQRGIHASPLRCDLLKTASIEQMMRTVERRFGRLDILVNLASIYETSEGSDPKRLRSWDKHLSSNARAAYELTLSAARLMKRSGGGRVVHISDWTSASGRPRYPGYSAYYVSKTAAKAVTESLALELAPTVLVNAIAPGPLLPPTGLTARDHKAVRQATPLGRWGGAGEIAKAVLFLVETDFVTGETVRVDGGRHLT